MPSFEGYPTQQVFFILIPEKGRRRRRRWLGTTWRLMFVVGGRSLGGAGRTWGHSPLRRSDQLFRGLLPLRASWSWYRRTTPTAVVPPGRGGGLPSKHVVSDCRLRRSTPLNGTRVLFAYRWTAVTSGMSWSRSSRYQNTVSTAELASSKSISG